jgi:hypothetical protein
LLWTVAQKLAGISGITSVSVVTGNLPFESIFVTYISTDITITCRSQKSCDFIATPSIIIILSSYCAITFPQKGLPQAMTDFFDCINSFQSVSVTKLVVS